MRTETKSLEWWFLEIHVVENGSYNAHAVFRTAANLDCHRRFPKYNFEIMFPEMVLDTDGRCEQCRQAEKNVSKP